MDDHNKYPSYMTNHYGRIPRIGGRSRYIPPSYLAWIKEEDNESSTADLDGPSYRNVTNTSSTKYGDDGPSYRNVTNTSSASYGDDFPDSTFTSDYSDSNIDDWIINKPSDKDDTDDESDLGLNIPAEQRTISSLRTNSVDAQHLIYPPVKRENLTEEEHLDKLRKYFTNKGIEIEIIKFKIKPPLPLQPNDPEFIGVDKYGNIIRKADKK